MKILKKLEKKVIIPEPNSEFDKGLTNILTRQKILKSQHRRISKAIKEQQTAVTECKQDNEIKTQFIKQLEAKMESIKNDEAKTDTTIPQNP